LNEHIRTFFIIIPGDHLSRSHDVLGDDVYRYELAVDVGIVSQLISCRLQNLSSIIPCLTSF